MPARKLHSYLGDSSRLQALTQQAQRLTALERTWKEIAPPPLASSATVGVLHGQTLVVFATNGATAAKLRQLLPSLVEKFQKRGFEVTAIRIEVQAPQRHAEAPRKKSAALSTTALESLAGLEQSLQASPLKDALQTLLRRHAASGQNEPSHGQDSAEDQKKNQGKFE
jgi:hypothetical protein